MALVDMDHKIEDLAYAAAFLDADGCVTITRKRGGKLGYDQYAVAVIISQKTPDVPVWLAETFGGMVRLQKPSKRPNGKRFPDMFKWSLYCQNAADFLELVIPYLKTKKVRSELCVKLARMSGRRGGTGWRYGGKIITAEEYQAREEIAILIRAENMKTSSRCIPIIPQEFGQC